MLGSSISQIEDNEVPEFEHAKKWQDQGAYPPLVPELAALDYLRLAWEVIRRTPRYRSHFHRLKRDGLLGEDAFPGGRRFISSHENARFVGWQSTIAKTHFTAPGANAGEKLQGYVRRQTGSWVVVHGHWYVKSAWGISAVPDPSTPAGELNLSRLFAPSRATLFPVYAGRVDAGLFVFPGRVSVDLSHREVLVRVRLDVPMREQFEQAKDGIAALQMRLGMPQAIGRKRDREERAQLWLRMWDAEHSGVGSREAKLHLQKEYKKAAARMTDRRFKAALTGWVEDRYDRIKSDGKAVIQGQYGESFLAACVGAGLAAIEEADYFSPVWQDT